MEYLVIFFILAILSVRYEIFGDQAKSKGNGFYYLACIILILFAGLRYRVGIDTLNYIALHDFMPYWHDILNPENIFLNRELGWLFISAIAKFIGDEFVYVQLIVSTIVNMSIFYYLYKYSTLKFTAVLIYFVVLYPYLNFEIMRESISISLFIVWGYNCILKAKWLQYFVIVLLCFLFHVSAIFLLLLPLFWLFIKSNPKAPYLIINTLIFLVGILLAPTFIRLIARLPLGELIDSKIVHYSQYEFSVWGNILTYFVYILFPLILRFFVSSEKNNLKRTLIMYSMVGALVGVFSIFFRLLNYCTPFLIIALTEVINSILKRKKGDFKILRTGFFFLFILVFFNYKLFLPAAKGYSIPWYARWYPYYSIISEETDPDREFIGNLF